MVNGEWRARTTPEYTQNYIVEKVGEFDNIIAMNVKNPDYCHLMSLAPELVKLLQGFCDSAERMSCWDKTPNDVYYKAILFLKKNNLYIKA
jgi:hypothetical protein